MRPRKKQPVVQQGAPRWMVTFSDLVTLILVFFILLFSMSQIDLIKFKAIQESFRDREILDFYPSVIPAEQPSEAGDKKEDSKDEESKDQEEASLEGLLNEVRTYLDKNGLNDVILADRTERGVVLVLQEKVLFESGEAEIVDGSNRFLDKVGDLLGQMPNLVKVEGHTDNRPITTVRYPSNWELSGARASSVIRYLVENHNLDNNRFIAVGYADTRPIVPNTTKKNLKKNRRVEIIISDPKYNQEDN